MDGLPTSHSEKTALYEWETKYSFVDGLYSQ